MPIKSSEVKDAKPVVKISAESINGIYTAATQKGLVLLQRGEKNGIFRIALGEVNEVLELLTEVRDAVKEHGVDVDESKADDYEVPTFKKPLQGDATADAATPSQSGVVSIATQGTAQPEVTQDPSLASETVETAQPDQPAAEPQTVSQANPFAVQESNV